MHRGRSAVSDETAGSSVEGLRAAFGLRNVINDSVGDQRRGYRGRRKSWRGVRTCCKSTRINLQVVCLRLDRASISASPGASMTLNQTTLRFPSGWCTLLKCPLSQSFQRLPYGPAPTRPERPLPSVKLSDAKDRSRCRGDANFEGGSSPSNESKHRHVAQRSLTLSSTFVTAQDSSQTSSQTKKPSFPRASMTSKCLI